MSFKVKLLNDGRAMLNVACGGRMHSDCNNIDFSFLVRLSKHPRLARVLNKARILSDKRYGRLLKTDPDIICWDLRKGIPFKDNTFDVVYHSHFLEHLDRKAAEIFLGECRRVLMQSGVMRVVVPDLEILCRTYLRTLEVLAQSEKLDLVAMQRHQESIWCLLGQMVATEPAGTAQQPYPLRIIERLVRGDTSKMGESHLWMYDRYTLEKLLSDNGLRDARVESPTTGRVEGWSEFYLDTNEDGSIYKPNSIYVEAIK